MSHMSHSESTMVDGHQPPEKSNEIGSLGVEELASVFSAIIDDWGREARLDITASRDIEDDFLIQIAEENRKIAPDSCASHDFFDANMAMDEAFKVLGVDMLYSNLGNDGSESESLRKLWGEAWGLANDFWEALLVERDLSASAGDITRPSITTCSDCSRFPTCRIEFQLDGTEGGCDWAPVVSPDQEPTRDVSCMYCDKVARIPLIYADAGLAIFEGLCPACRSAIRIETTIVGYHGKGATQ